MIKVFKKTNLSYLWRGAVGYYHATPGIDRVPELYLEDILGNPLVYQYVFSIIILDMYNVHTVKQY